MFNWFKKKPSPPASPTFKQRTRDFWKWYAERADRFYQTIEAGHCSDLAPEVSEGIDSIFGHFAWVFGPGANGIGHSFTLTGEGVLHRQLLAAYAVSQAPTLKGWTFYASRQPKANVEHFGIKIYDHDFQARECWLTPDVNREDEQIDLTFCHPVFPKLEEKDRWLVTSLLLDDALGEIGASNHIGTIEFSDQRLGEAFPLSELRSFVEKTRTEQGWKCFGPGQAYSLFRNDEAAAGEMRSEIVTACTTCTPLITKWQSGGIEKDPLEDTGADFVFVAFDKKILPKGGEANARGEMEDALDNALTASASGQCLGGALGWEWAYVDLLIFDGEASIEIIRRVVRDLGLPRGTKLEYFAKAKRERRVALV